MSRYFLVWLLEQLIQPFRRRRLLVLGVPLIITLPAWWVEVGLTQLVQRNANDYLMVACEVATESGDDFITAGVDHADMLEHYIGRTNGKLQPRLLRLLYPKLSPQIELKPVVDSLRGDLGGQSNARKRIQAAAGAIEQFLRSLEDSSSARIVTFRPEPLSKEVVEAVNEALDKSDETVKEYEDAPTVDRAETACRANRRAIALVYLARCEHQHLIGEEKLKKFRHNVDRTIYYNDTLRKTASREKRELLRLYSNSELRRLKIIQAILDNDMQEARDLLITAIEEAYKTERRPQE